MRLRNSTMSLGVVFFMIGISGCATARLGTGPDAFSLQNYAGRPTVAVSKVVDSRSSQKVGSIGATSVKVKSNVADLTTNYLMDVLNKDLSLNIEQAPAITSSNASSVIVSKAAKGAVTAEITEIKLLSLDALLQPVEVNMSLNVKVYDAGGVQLLEQTVSGNYEKRIGFTANVDKTTGELIEKTVENVTHNIATNQQIQSALNRL